MAKLYKVYVSHSWKRFDELERLRNLLQLRGYFHVSFLEASPERAVNSKNEYYIRQKLTEKINTADVVLAMAGVYATMSEWINFELEVAGSLGIPIIGIIPRGQLKLSSTVQDYAKEIVRWNTESIVEAIRRNA